MPKIELYHSKELPGGPLPQINVDTGQADVWQKVAQLGENVAQASMQISDRVRRTQEANQFADAQIRAIKALNQTQLDLREEPDYNTYLDKYQQAKDQIFNAELEGVKLPGAKRKFQQWFKMEAEQRNMQVAELVERKEREHSQKILETFRDVAIENRSLDEMEGYLQHLVDQGYIYPEQAATILDDTGQEIMKRNHLDKAFRLGLDEGTTYLMSEENLPRFSQEERNSIASEHQRTYAILNRANEEAEAKMAMETEVKINQLFRKRAYGQVRAILDNAEEYGMSISDVRYHTRRLEQELSGGPSAQEIDTNESNIVFLDFARKVAEDPNLSIKRKRELLKDMRVDLTDPGFSTDPSSWPSYLGTAAEYFGGLSKAEKTRCFIGYDDYDELMKMAEKMEPDAVYQQGMDHIDGKRWLSDEQKAILKDDYHRIYKNSPQEMSSQEATELAEDLTEKRKRSWVGRALNSLDPVGAVSDDWMQGLRWMQDGAFDGQFQSRRSQMKGVALKLMEAFTDKFGKSATPTLKPNAEGAGIDVILTDEDGILWRYENRGLVGGGFFNTPTWFYWDAKNEAWRKWGQHREGAPGATPVAEDDRWK